MAQDSTHGTALPRSRSGIGKALGLSILLIASEGQALAKRKFDFVVGVDGDWKAAVAAAAKKATATYRYYVFIPEGEYDIGTLTGDSNQKSTFSTANVSLIGQNPEKTVLFNRSTNEGIGITATLYLNNADNLYMQDLTVMNRANYGQPSTYGATGRHVAIQEQSDKLVYKNVRLLSTQDTYYTKGTRTYWEGGRIDGTTDFICGGGDVFFEGVELNELKDGAPITASSPSTPWGYVFRNCTINATKDGYLLGRSWGEARVVFLNTTMNKLPAEAGWGNPMNAVPKVFAEYGSRDGSGRQVDLSKRRTTYTKDATTVVLDPTLTAAEAAGYTLANVLGGSDGWKPDGLTRQIPAPTARLDGTTLRWNDNDSALCWIVFKGGSYLANVATNSYDVSGLSKGDVVTVRAANAMGGLGPGSPAVVVGSTSEVSGRPMRVPPCLSHSGRILSVSGIRDDAELRIFDASGSLRRTIVLSASDSPRTIGLASLGLEAGAYVGRISGGRIRSEAVEFSVLE